MKSIAIGGMATMAGAELLQPIFDLYTSLTNRGASGQQALKIEFPFNASSLSSYAKLQRCDWGEHTSATTVGHPEWGSCKLGWPSGCAGTLK
jgi:hypothetical protein